MKKWVEMARESIRKALKYLDAGDWSMAVWMLANAIERLITAYQMEEFREE